MSQPAKSRLFWAIIAVYCFLGVIEGVKTVRENDARHKFEQLRKENEEFLRDNGMVPFTPPKVDRYSDGCAHCDPLVKL